MDRGAATTDRARTHVSGASCVERATLMNLRDVICAVCREPPIGAKYRLVRMTRNVLGE